MGSHSVDSGTQKATSAASQANDAQLTQNAQQNQQFANQARSTLFGTYNPTTNQYSGGTESQFLNPSSMNTKNLSGAYANEYNTLANQTAQGAQNAVGTSMQNLASRGMGASPAGFAADQQRQAYQTQAGQNGQNYSSLFGQQHQEDVNNFTNANNMLGNNSVGAQNASLQGSGTAAGNYASLYGTSSQQTPSAWSTALGGIAGLAGAGATAYAGRKG